MINRPRVSVPVVSVVSHVTCVGGTNRYGKIAPHNNKKRERLLRERLAGAHMSDFATATLTTTSSSTRLNGLDD